MDPVGLSFLFKKRSKTETFLKRLRTFSAQVRIYKWMQRDKGKNLKGSRIMKADDLLRSPLFHGRLKVCSFFFFLIFFLLSPF